MKKPSLRGLKYYAAKRLGLHSYFHDCGDGRQQPRIAAHDLLWAILAGHSLRQTSFHAIEALVHSSSCREFGVLHRFGDDTLSYFTERLAPEPTRMALVGMLRRAKRNKAFDAVARIGLAIDGTTVGRCSAQGCANCRPYRNSAGEIAGYRHHLAMISVVGTGLSLPFDVEPYGPKDSEYAAGQRLLKRTIPALGARFADYLVVDAGFATSTFLHAADEAGIPVVARLKGNLHELMVSVERCFGTSPPDRVLQDGKDRVELWDDDRFDPWETLQWDTVRVVRYRQTKPDGTVVRADWLTNLTPRQANSLAIYKMAKSRWEIENEGFNDCKSRQGFEHICHHHANSLLIGWLLTLVALVVLRLYRLRYLHRGTHPVLSAIDLVRSFWLSLGQKRAIDTG
ncbi:transposase [uncultured Paludibaculum sp.]|uniref:transposase n=1 Tax=uncultured Paludibaculum sp. TaxID=1765020 RepID=UPI002AAB08E4|nr:transposase [uncultured Paludibaculum sp.]